MDNVDNLVHKLDSGIKQRDSLVDKLWYNADDNCGQCGWVKNETLNVNFL